MTLEQVCAARPDADDDETTDYPGSLIAGPLDLILKT